MEDSRLENLMTYTVFHIGLYVSLFAALIGAGIFGSLDHFILRFAVGCFLVAGICGAVVGSNISEHPNFKSFSDAELGPWGLPIWSYRVWTTLEHLAFWLGILPLVVAFLWAGPSAFKTR